ncbi:MAG TPA: hypothetical protein PKA63_02170 [Oligoflexia bacterium]|nr:hypothetical protein [Oligoflexia bacterium]HMP47457.1 hypothetical protein [Oligoflexia bacterium]
MQRSCNIQSNTFFCCSGLRLAVLFSLVIFSLSIGCGGGGGGGPRGNSQILDKAVSYATRCGVVVDGSVKNPSSAADAEAVTVEPVSSDTVVVTRLEGSAAGTTQLVKLHAVSAGNSFSNGIGVNRMRALLGSGPAALVIPSYGSRCAIETSGAGEGIVGQLFTPSGQSVTETLLSSGILSASNDVCESELISGCYAQIEAESVSPKRITDFLWKPISESNGNLAILVDPRDITVVVTGAVSETLINTGPSNGRGTTARSAANPGARFGTNVLVEFFDENGKRVLINNGDRSIIIANGRDRVRTFY